MAWNEDERGRRSRESIEAVMRETTGDPHERLVLLGAGASVEAGLPDGAALDTLLRSYDALKFYNEASSVLGGLAGFPDVERAVRVLEAVAELEGDSLVRDLRQVGFVNQTKLGSREQADAELFAIKKLLRQALWKVQTGMEVLAAMAKGFVYDTPDEVAYLEPLVRAQRGGTIASLNYDNCLELAAPQYVRVTEAHKGHVRVPLEEADRTRVLKLHGSLDWKRRGDDVLGGARPREALDYEPAIVFGAGNKLRHYGPFLELFRHFSDVLDRSRVVMTIGFGYRDPHITNALRLWASRPHTEGKVKRLIVCLGPSGTELPGPTADWEGIDNFEIEPLLMPASEMGVLI